MRAFRRWVVGQLEVGVVRPLCVGVEEDLRLRVHAKTWGGHLLPPGGAPSGGGAATAAAPAASSQGGPGGGGGPGSRGGGGGAHGGAASSGLGAAGLRAFLDLGPLRVCGLSGSAAQVSLRGRVEEYLERTFYNLTAVALYDWLTYADMRNLGNLRRLAKPR